LNKVTLFEMWRLIWSLQSRKPNALYWIAFWKARLKV
jgi:hypothetical protein